MSTRSPRKGPPTAGGDGEKGAADRDERSGSWVNSSTLGIQIVITFIVLAWAGIWLDVKYETDPWGTLGGVALGMFAMFATMLREAGIWKSLATREREAAEREAADREAGEANRVGEERTRTEAEDERGPS